MCALRTFKQYSTFINGAPCGNSIVLFDLSGCLTIVVRSLLYEPDPFKMKCIDFSCLKYLLSNRSFSKPTVTNDYTNNESLQFETTATVMEQIRGILSVDAFICSINFAKDVTSALSGTECVNHKRFC